MKWIGSMCTHPSLCVYLYPCSIFFHDIRICLNTFSGSPVITVIFYNGLIYCRPWQYYAFSWLPPQRRSVTIRWQLHCNFTYSFPWKSPLSKIHWRVSMLGRLCDCSWGAASHWVTDATGLGPCSCPDCRHIFSFELMQEPMIPSSDTALQL